MKMVCYKTAVLSLAKELPFSFPIVFKQSENIFEPSLESVGQILCALPGKPMFKPPQRSMIIEMRLSMLRKP